MTDLTLLKLIKTAEADPSDEAALHALADALGEASGQDRLEAVRCWVSLRGELLRAQARAAKEISPPLVLPPATTPFTTLRLGGPWCQTFQVGYSLPPAGHADPQHERHATEAVERRVLEGFGRATQRGRWYAVRLRVDTRHAADWGMPLHMRRQEVVARLDIEPLDGGTVTMPKGEAV